jgi:hypothetical protein
MANKFMYFGTQERMTWVKCPAYNPDISKVGWQTTNQFLNGGASVRRSSTAHKEYQFAWNLTSASNIAAITDYADGLYGDGLIYFLDPFATTTNLLPQSWAAPRLGAEDGVVFNGKVRPTLSATSANAFGYPTKSATYTFDASSVFETLFIPIPDGYVFYFGAHGSSTGTAAVAISDVNAATVVTNRINYVTNPSFAADTSNWSASGTGATLARVAATGSDGTGYARLTSGAAATAKSANGNTFAVVAGQSFAFSAYVRGTVGRAVALRATWTGATATSTVALASASAWQRITFTGTVPAGATAVRIDVTQTATGGVIGDVLDIDAVLAELSTTTVGTFFDGYMLPTSVSNVRTRNIWTGAPLASPSQQIISTAPGTAITLLPETTSTLTNYEISGVTGVNISFWGSGTITLSGMIAQVRVIGDPAPTGSFIGGRGHSGCRFAASPSVQGYSAPQALDYQSMSVTLVETGSWE